MNRDPLLWIQGMGMLASNIKKIHFEYKPDQCWIETIMEMGISLTNRWLYFSDWGTHPKIERIGMDGNLNSRTTIVKDNIQWPNGLCLDYANEKVYWIDAKLKSIFAADLDGTNVKRILHNAEQILHPFSLTIFEVILQFFWGFSKFFFIIWNVITVSMTLFSFSFFFPRTMFTGQIGHQRPFVRSTSSLGKNTHNWPLVWDHQWTLKYIMNKDSCTVSRLANIFVNLSRSFFVDFIIDFCLCIDLRNEILFSLTGPNKCGHYNGGCSHLCLPTPTEYNANGYACACPDNMVLMSGKQCHISGKWSILMDVISAHYCNSI